MQRADGDDTIPVGGQWIQSIAYKTDCDAPSSDCLFSGSENTMKPLSSHAD
jgi:hypothetical protein